MREDFTAFDGSLIQTQANFVNLCITTILARYHAYYQFKHHHTKDKRYLNPPRSLMVVAHSMGGVGTFMAPGSFIIG
jgi:hypothetical protein